MRMYIDKSKCTGCRMCQLVCSVKKYGEFNVHRGHCYLEEGEIVPNTAMFCRQCKRPFCKEACKFDAFEETANEGVLTINRDKCTKCLACVKACPFHMVLIDGQDGFPMKCDLCGGESQCVKQCPFQALEVK
ncbi:4Fe-4S dicluster domain-containing protein [Sinanaerobacter chloroacetimidivorans]|jgi:carbon-monoxide dehydrogenase iron sulfur subunit|uniref:4Fe-4S dicluster domain-containing protein n=1 Tax=Sinanaerobacter chloroacetimidivorans TaxID=2818044 RepID=A0A8J7VYM2_9FIRM|nr:4Fe-4S dicluster domain-containing protein [Sinanaerobacter chloroacetimidivorans]MBR0597464.1 4Fe-4S dicluster domain-containing protein [Sinanaerobacter chloroacetimidivorans]